MNQEMEQDLAGVRRCLGLWCQKWGCAAKLEVFYDADLDDDNSDGE